MSWWGKVVGGTLGFMMGGPLGALLGLSLGHSFDSSTAKRGQGLFPGDQERTQAAFFTATFSVMGHMAKADGRVSPQEISLAEMLIKEMRLKQEKKAFEEGKLYLDLRYYQSAVHSFENMLKDFPETTNAAQVRYLIIRSNYLFAENSIKKPLIWPLNTSTGIKTQTLQQRC